MKSLTDCYKLANGVEIPCIGFGTWQTPDGDVCVSSVKAAIAAGYRHIDTAEMYENEDSVGKAIKECGVSREELFVTSKLNNTEHGYEKTMAAFEGTMEKLGLEYLDLFLIHWPNPIAFRDHWQEANAGTWKAFEELYKAGRVRAIGISNFRQHHIEALMETATVPPMVNQMKLCPGETQEDHEELMAFVDEMEFERLGVFAYSAEEDTPAYSFPDQVPQEVKEDRRDEIMQLQQEIAFEKSEAMVGRVLTVLIEGKVVDEPAYVGRTYMDAPGVDGLIFVNADVELMSGDFVRVRVTGSAEYDLIGEIYDESAQ